ncbi:MAG TPA: adenylate cyclase [Sutterella sp.]|nr:adenylate cyclase [Sutterella sp.]
MAQEIERKFLVTSDAWRTLGVPESYRQGYLATGPECIVRVRIEGSRARLTVKGRPNGIVRPEYEYPIPLSDAVELLDMIGPDRQITKNRTKIPFKGKIWEVDEFLGENKGLIVAEIELKSVNEPFEKPDWIGNDVSVDSRYYNVSLMQHPYSKWKS